jgi:hypothetical protein
MSSRLMMSGLRIICTVRLGRVKETLNALLDAEADRLCNAQRYERSEARCDTLLAITRINYRSKLANCG